MQIKSLKSRLCLGFIPLLVIMVTSVAWVAHWEMEEILYTHVDHIAQAKSNGLTSIFNAVSDANEQRRLVNGFVGNGDDETSTLYCLWETRQQRVLLTNTTLGGTPLPWMTQATKDAVSLLTHGLPFSKEIDGAA